MCPRAQCDALTERSVVGIRPPRMRLRRSRAALALVSVLAGGSVFTSCDTRFRGAVINGAKSTFFTTFLNPAAIFEVLTGAQLDDPTAGA